MIIGGGISINKKICLVLCSAIVFTGCKKPQREPIPVLLEPVQTTVRTESTYTGTTVDFIHVETSGPYRYPNAYDMPEFGNINDIDSPFDSDFYGLFSQTMPSVEYPAVSYVSETSVVTGEGTQTKSDTYTSFSDISDNEMTVTAINRLDSSETAVCGSLPEETLFIETVTTASFSEQSSSETATTFDIMQYMPKPEDYPDFNSFTFDTAIFN